MLQAAVRDRARALITQRMQVRNDQLDWDLRRFTDRLVRVTDDDDEMLRMEVKLRLLCEQDLADRARLIWNSLRAAHQALDGKYQEGLVGSLKEELRAHMRSAGVSLAATMRERSDELQAIFIRPKAIDAEWLARQRNNAAEHMSKPIQEYVHGLSRSWRATLGRFWRGER